MWVHVLLWIVSTRNSDRRGISLLVAILVVRFVLHLNVFLRNGLLAGGALGPAALGAKEKALSVLELALNRPLTGAAPEAAGVKLLSTHLKVVS